MDSSETKNKRNDVILSICIPTYNRVEKTVGLVKSILTYKEMDIEVVVLDNCSSDNTQNALNAISDTRFVYRRNDRNIGGMPNILKSLTYGSGKYVMLCLDKDSISAEHLNVFINKIKNTKIVAGHCSLNSTDYGNDIIYGKGFESILSFAYNSEHPSGIFILNRVLKSNSLINKIIEDYGTFAFLPELLKAEVVLSGHAARINMPLVYTETKDECAVAVSHTYKGENIYFLPSNIINTFNIYLNHISSLNLTTESKSVIINKIYNSLLLGSTLEYKNIMMDRSICSHHGLVPRKIKKKELLGIIFNFNKNFFSKKNPNNLVWKLKVVFISNLKLVFKILIK
ncbi:glycosyltransferase [Chryseobacterium sp. Leaf394]|uniref:glycosyltransferase family 2 protein n=1 Tax=Chryseobacterium sp. Leaf394 TaxID=1736361 RepID=UPI0006F77370|nr:glycosyltransferase [Chryseobacterium sp. Leaf394]KQS93206.1 hypothetical protein ASG21_12515 [Chryseobacterium sp. Leaf394]